MFYYLYEISNKLNGKIYVGVHKTVNLNDGYMGSGKVISASIQKYGADNFSKRILEMFDSATEMYAREAEVVTDEFLLREDVYNLRRGGLGGFDHINKIGKNGFSDKEVAKKARRITNEILIQKYGSMSEFSSKCANSDSAKAKRKITREERGIKSSTVHMQTAEVNAKRIKTMRETGFQTGEKNSQFGRRWCTDGTVVLKLERGQELPENFVYGKKLKVPKVRQPKVHTKDAEYQRLSPMCRNAACGNMLTLQQWLKGIE